MNIEKRYRAFVLMISLLEKIYLQSSMTEGKSRYHFERGVRFMISPSAGWPDTEYVLEVSQLGRFLGT
jgi:hypothetical protein